MFFYYFFYFQQWNQQQQQQQQQQQHQQQTGAGGILANRLNPGQQKQDNPTLKGLLNQGPQGLVPGQPLQRPSVPQQQHRLPTSIIAQQLQGPPNATMSNPGQQVLMFQGRPTREIWQG